MAKPLIPLRPDNFYTQLSQQEQSCLTWLVLSGCPRKEAYLTFAHPEFLTSGSKASFETLMKEFFASKDAKAYLEAYQKTLDEFFHAKPVKSEPKGSLEERKAKAKTKLVEFAMSLADNIDQATDPEFVLKVADKAGLLDGDEEVEEQPRRYLPVSPCLTGCAYRMFCEENTEDMCQYCKYHRFGEENGIHYDKTEILNVPLHSGTELENE